MTSATILEIQEKTSQYGKYTVVKVGIGEKVRTLRLSKKFSDQDKLVLGANVELDIFEGKNAGYINKIGNIGTPTQSTPVAQPRPQFQPLTKAESKPTMSKEDWEKKDKEKADGLARGNYRTGAMAFICTHYQLKGELPVPELLVMFNDALKDAEEDYFNPSPKEADNLI